MQEPLDYIKTAVVIEDVESKGILRFTKYYVIADQKEFIKNKDELFFKEYTPTKGDKIYIYPESTIPRFKIKQFCENTGVAIVKVADKANIKIASEKSVTSLFKRWHCYGVSKDAMTNMLKLRNHSFPNASELINILATSTNPKVYMKYGIERIINQRSGMTLQHDYSWFDHFDDKAYYLKFHDLMTADNLYSQNEILRRLNTGAVMDEKQYEGARQLLNSKDMENTKLAIEIMANCDFEKSSVYLLLLIRDFGSKIFDCPNRTHVNFKSLLKFFNITNLRGVDLNDIMSTLIDLKLLNQANLNKLQPELIEDMETYVSDYLVSEKIGYSEKVMKALEENILDKNTNTEIVLEEPEIINPHL